MGNLAMSNIVTRSVIFLFLTVALAKSLPHVMFNRSSLLNHSLVYFSEIGNSDDGNDSLQCYTGLETNGDWFFPNGTRLSQNTKSAIYQYYDTTFNRVDLRVNNTTLSGMYHCIANNRSWLFYVGLYNKGQGNIGIKIVGPAASRDSIPFIITCISTGGPATSVTWKRYHVVLTEGNSSLLVNATTAEYNHTLEDTHGGVYQCIVSNRHTNIQEISDVNSGTVGPRDFMANQIGLQSIRVSWNTSMTSSSTVRYVIFYNNLNGHYNNLTINNSRTNSSIISGLISGSEYHISAVEIEKNERPSRSENRIIHLCHIDATVITTNSTAITLSMELNGLTEFLINIEWMNYYNVSSDCHFDDDGMRNNITRNVTDFVIGDLQSGTLYNISVTENSTEFCESVEMSKMTETAAPTSFPPNFTALAISSTSVRLEWKMVPCDKQGGIISEYVLYQNFSSIKNGLLGPQTLNITINQLDAATFYIFEIAARNIIGDGPNSTAEITTLGDDLTTTTEILTSGDSPNATTDILTPEDGVNTTTDISTPGEDSSETEESPTQVGVPMLFVKNTSATSTFVSWTSAGVHDVWYNLTWTRDTSSSCPGVQQNSTGPLDSSILNFTLEGLEENSLYSVMVIAWNNSRSEINSKTFITNISMPSAAPSSVMAMPTPVSITVLWNQIHCRDENGPNTGYIVMFKTTAGNDNYQNTTSNTNTTIIPELTPSTNYSIKVAAMNSAGIGPYSNPVDIKTASITINTTIGYTFISLIWDYANSIMNTAINYSNINNTDCFNDSNTSSTYQTNYNLTKLEEGTQYNITLTIFFSEGSVINFNITPMPTTSIRPPTGSPQSVTVMVNSSTSYDIRWDPVNCRDRNGLIIGYLLTYKTVSGEYTRQINITNDLRHRLQNLNKTTVYTVQVSARNAAGLSNLSEAVIFKTPDSTFLSLNGRVILNNSYVNINDIGSTESSALLCHTDYNVSRQNSTGNWYGPEGVRVGRVGQDRVPGFRRKRGTMIVRLIRNITRARIPKEGIYACNINSSETTLSLLLVRLYLNSPGNITVFDNVLFTVTHHLDKSKAQFVITCTSTGGIPANVTWMRNGNITSRDTQPILVNLSSQTYNYSLKVEGRHEGVYTCLVRGLYNSDSANITVKAPSIPIGVKVIQTGFNSVNVSWTPGEDLVTGYLVSYNLSESLNVNKSVSSITLNDLLMENTYSISIIATSNNLHSYHANTTAYIELTTISVTHSPVSPVAGEQVTLTCSLSLPEILRNADTKFLWEHKGRPINNIISGSSNSSLVTFPKVSMSQAGIYSCIATLDGSIINTTTLDITNPIPESNDIVSNFLDIAILGPAVAGAVIGFILLILVVVCICVLIRKRNSIPISKVKRKPLFSPRTAGDIYWDHSDDDREQKKGIEMNILSTKEDTTSEEGNDIPVARFPDYVRLMHENGDDQLKQQYTALEELSVPPCEIGRQKSNFKQNRFKNIYPYDFNRVILKDDDNGSDYINASFINGYKDAMKTYIAAQGPTDATVSRFLEMLWQYNVPTIVMLTRCVEDGKEKCRQYWSDQLETTLTNEKFSVTLKSYLPSAEYQIRKFQLTRSDEPEKEMCITHMLYTAWPDHGVPHNAMSLISFIRRVRREHPASLSQPLLVHCSAGVGRTGTFILLDLAIQQIANEGSINVMSQLKKLRQQRMKLVQTQMQYNFIHDSLSELVFCGETEISAADITIAMSQLQRQVPGDVAAMTGLEKQFQCLVQLSSQNNALYQEAEAKYNAGKNRFPDVLPNELHRVRLRYTQKKGSDYINASFVDGYKQRRAYIATQGPMAGTVADFWRMVWEHSCSCIAMLCELHELHEGGQESSHCFWPQGTSVLADDTQPEEIYGKLKVTLKSSTPHGDIILRKLVIEEMEGKSLNSRIVTLLQLSSWPPGELPHPTSVLSLIDLLGVAQRSSPSKHTVIMCSDGVGRTGTFICIHSQLERLKTEGVVDFLQGIKSARIQRAGLVPDSVHYAFCHDVVATYLDSFDTYANFKEVV